jgi:hypothetical protein
MSEVLAKFAEPLLDDDGVVYRAQATGTAMPDGLWEGWIEFIPVAGGAPVRTPRETVQPNRNDAIYWATGLTAVYLEGALDRALKPLVRHVAAAPEPAFDEPAPTLRTKVEVPASVEVPDAVLDQFAVYENGEAMLRKRLGALAAWHLVNIILAYDLSDEPKSTLDELPASSLIELIIATVRQRSAGMRQSSLRH